MKTPFRQGIVRYQTNLAQAPVFLYKENTGNYISLHSSSVSIIVTFAHGDTDYLHEETQSITNAWGPFLSGHDYWLYWDINLASSVRTFGSTQHAPIVSNTKPNAPALDQHWYDKINHQMFFWNGTKWAECLRVFAGTYTNGSILTPKPIGTQVSDNTPVNAGYILFDDNEKPVRRARVDGKGRFLTTESQFYTNKSAVASVSFEAIMHYAEATQDLADWNVVSYVADGGIALASNSDIDQRPAFGIIRSGMAMGSIGAVVTKGYVTNPSWNWASPASTPLYLIADGLLSITPPGTGFIQQVAIITAPDTIFVDVLPQIIHYSGQSTITMPVEVDLMSGKLTTASRAAAGGGSSASTLDDLLNVSNANAAATNSILTKTTGDWQSITRASLLSTESINALADVIINTAASGQVISHNGTNWVNKKIFHTASVSSSATWTVVHNLGCQFVNVTIYDNTNNVIIPESIVASSINITTITFNVAVAGTAVIMGVA